MPDFNRVQLMGRLTFDPELRRIPSGTAVTELRMAVNKTWRDKNGDKKEEVTYVDVTIWDKLAELCAQYLSKGSAVFVEGSLKMDKWTDKSTGENRSKLKVQGENVQFLDSKPRDGGGGNQSHGRQEAPRQNQAPASRGGRPGTGPSAMSQAEADQEDIPFNRPASFDENEFWGDVVHGRQDDKAML